MNNSAIRFCLAQLDFHVGAITNNRDKIISSIVEANSKHADVIIFPELALTGYPPEDLLYRPDLLRQTEAALKAIVKATPDISVILGAPSQESNTLFNSCYCINNQKIIAVYHKQQLPNYAVFDEKRYFTAGNESCVIDLNGTQTSISICEDLWHEGPIKQAKDKNATLLININASPFHTNKQQRRQELLRDRANDFEMDIIYLNQVGGQDELVFDGDSMLVASNGDIEHSCPQFNEALFYFDYSANSDKKFTSINIPEIKPVDSLEILYKALVMGVRDYVQKNGFKGVVIGLSGGIDSALTLSIAVDALGADQVQAIMMPSEYTAGMSIEDATQQARTLNVEFDIIAIKSVFESFLQLLAPLFKDLPADTTEENIQARSRGVLLMAISNKKRRLVLTTGNKSEMAVGYATLYGDMAGGFAPLKDVPKTKVYELARWLNRNQVQIPWRVIERPPSAELRPDQKDEDSLPAYEILDPILEAYIEKDMSPQEIVALGYEAEIVKHVCRLVDINEYKRRQAAPGVRVSQRAFGRDRRYPITSGYREE